MLFVVDSPTSLRMIAIVRDDRTPALRGQKPFLRLAAKNFEGESRSANESDQSEYGQS